MEELFLHRRSQRRLAQVILALAVMEREPTLPHNRDKYLARQRAEDVDDEPDKKPEPDDVPDTPPGEPEPIPIKEPPPPPERRGPLIAALG